MGTSLSGRELCSRKKGGSGIGKTKVGKGSKVMLVVDGNGLPIGLYLDSAQPHEITLADKTLKTIRVPQKRGRSRTRPKSLAADKAYDSRTFRTELRERGIRAVIPTFERRKRKKPKRGRPIKVGAEYKSRWKVERSFAWMDNCRRLVVRWERSLHIYEAFCLVA
jgi:transposase